ncbi:hypothetical protein B0A48_17765 [Cryoendolithus antarcticus]|uniref:Uncharacterized protein n=1 Tax=Cryoendolithus antarcticus TaxID=1507870 RepID=A0A1V8S9P4_9PEZI|nr:hypothetical protein B0A48_17765 [Cryoendolithus antarcticus]
MLPRNSPTPSLASEAPFVDIDLDIPEGTQPPNSLAQGSPPRIELGDEEATQYNEEERAEIRAFLDLLDASHGVLAPVSGLVRIYDPLRFRFNTVSPALSIVQHNESQAPIREETQRGCKRVVGTASTESSTIEGALTNSNDLTASYENGTGPTNAQGIGSVSAGPRSSGTISAVQSTNATVATSLVIVSSEPSSPASSQDSFEQPIFETTTGLPSYRAHILDEGLRRQRSRLDSTASSLSSLSSDSASDIDSQHPGFPDTSSQER